MGTSKRYYPPSSPSWSKAKADLSKLVNSNNIAALPNLVGKFVGLTLDNTEPLGRHNVAAVTNAVRNIGSFIQSLQGNVIDRSRFWRDFEITPGMSLYEVDRALVDLLLPNADTRAKIAAREALLRLLHDLLDPGCTDDPLHSLEERLTAESLEAILHKYIGYFVYELFLQDFSEILLGRHAPDTVDSICQAAKDYILIRVDGILPKRTLDNLDWLSAEGLKVADELSTEVWYVLEGEPLP